MLVCRPRDVLVLVLRQGVALAVGGLAVAAAVSSVMTSLLYGVEPTDPLTIVAACFALLAVALVAGLVPARRALRVDPVTALRHE